MAEFRKLRLGEGDSVREYALLPMPPTKAVNFIAKVTQALAPMLLGEGDLQSIMQKDDIAGAVKLILGGLKEIDPDNLTDLIKDALAHEVYAGHKKLNDSVHFDDWFTEHPGDMLQVCAWAIWENSKAFFPGGREFLDYLASKVKAGGALSFPKAGSPSTPSAES